MSKKQKFEDNSYYTDKEGKEYFCFGGVMIEISEHFAEQGKEYSSLLTELTENTIQSTNNNVEIHLRS